MTKSRRDDPPLQPECGNLSQLPTDYDPRPTTNHYSTSPADDPTHSIFLLWSTPIIGPRPIRTMISTGVSSFSQTYMIRNSALVGPCGVSITGVKFSRSCKMYSPRFSDGIASMSFREGAITTPSPANEYRGFSTKFSRSEGTDGS